MTGIILALLIPLILLLVIVICGVICLIIFARAHGNIKNLDKKQKRWFLFFGLFPVLLIVIFFSLIVLSTSQSKKELRADIESGELIVYTVSPIKDPSKTREINVSATSSTPVALKFDIFDENLYIERDKYGTVKVLTKEFEEFKHITKNGLASVFFSERVDIKESVYERHLKDEYGEFKKQVTAIGTLYEYEDINSIDESGSFVWIMKFANRDDNLLIRVDYRSINDQSIKRSPVISREYAKSLYDLMTSSIELHFIKSVPGVITPVNE